MLPDLPSIPIPPPMSLPIDEKRLSTSERLYAVSGKDLETTGDREVVIGDLDNGEINEMAVVAEGEERTTWFVWILVAASAISGLLFGMHWCRK